MEARKLTAVNEIVVVQFIFNLLHMLPEYATQLLFWHLSKPSLCYLWHSMTSEELVQNNQLVKRSMYVY